jgi:hypothetical protein
MATPIIERAAVERGRSGFIVVFAGQTLSDEAWSGKVGCPLDLLRSWCEAGRDVTSLLRGARPWEGKPAPEEPASLVSTDPNEYAVVRKGNGTGPHGAYSITFRGKTQGIHAWAHDLKLDAKKLLYYLGAHYDVTPYFRDGRMPRHRKNDSVNPSPAPALAPAPVPERRRVMATLSAPTPPAPAAELVVRPVPPSESRQQIVVMVDEPPHVTDLRRKLAELDRINEEIARLSNAKAAIVNELRGNP